MRKLSITAVVVLALVATACGNSKKSAEVKGAATYNVSVDAAAPPQYQISTYFPSTLTVRPGDTIVFKNQSVGNPHTVTLGIKADRSDAPKPVTPQGVENPVAFGPCFSATAPTGDLTACPTPGGNPASPPEFNGKGFWNSGVITKPGNPNGVTLKLSSDIPTGDYAIVCLLHPFMAATLKVASSDADRITPAKVTTAADASANDLIAAAAKLAPPAAKDAQSVSAGWGDRITVVQGFAPQNVSVKVGQTVTWTDGTAYEPHTITFKSPFKSPEDNGATQPAGDKSGGTYSGGFTSSGLIGPAPFFPVPSFSLKFAKAGTYPYVCVIHPGMAGTVTVTA